MNLALTPVILKSIFESNGRCSWISSNTFSTTVSGNSASSLNVSKSGSSATKLVKKRSSSAVNTF